MLPALPYFYAINDDGSVSAILYRAENYGSVFILLLAECSEPH